MLDKLHVLAAYHCLYGSCVVPPRFHRWHKLGQEFFPLALSRLKLLDAP
jgi:hypothetical protein